MGDRANVDVSTVDWEILKKHRHKSGEKGGSDKIVWGGGN